MTPPSASARSSSTPPTPPAIAGFWSRLLDRPLVDGANQYFAVVRRPPDGSVPALMFLAVPEPRNGKNRLHLDLVSPDQPAEVDGRSASGRPGSATSTSTAPAGPPWPTRRATCSTSGCPHEDAPAVAHIRRR